MIKTFNTLFVTMFGLGKIPKIPGTFGSLATVIILYIFFHILDLSSTIIKNLVVWLNNSIHLLNADCASIVNLSAFDRIIVLKKFLMILSLLYIF